MIADPTHVCYFWREKKMHFPFTNFAMYLFSAFIYESRNAYMFSKNHSIANYLIPYIVIFTYVIVSFSSRNVFFTTLSLLSACSWKTIDRP